MRKVKGFILSDGSFFEERSDAVDRQKELDFLFEIRELATEYTHSDEAEKDIVNVIRFQHKRILDLYLKYRELIDLKRYELWRSQEE